MLEHVFRRSVQCAVGRRMDEGIEGRSAPGSVDAAGGDGEECSMSAQGSKELEDIHRLSDREAMRSESSTSSHVRFGFRMIGDGEKGERREMDRKR